MLLSTFSTSPVAAQVTKNTFSQSGISGKNTHTHKTRKFTEFNSSKTSKRHPLKLHRRGTSGQHRENTVPEPSRCFFLSRPLQRMKNGFFTAALVVCEWNTPVFSSLHSTFSLSLAHPHCRGHPPEGSLRADRVSFVPFRSVRRSTSDYDEEEAICVEQQQQNSDDEGKCQM